MKYPALPKIPLIITGLTATGKTKLALELASEFNLNLISADSRQVYRTLDIGTGKYSPGQQVLAEGACVFIDKVAVFGLDLVDPDQHFSAAQYQKYVQSLLLQQSYPDSILVGGTGQYLSALLNPPATYFIPPHTQLRAEFANLEKHLSPRSYAALLQGYLNQVAPEKYQQLNSSDIQNPRRLQRAIEVQLQSAPAQMPAATRFQVPIVGLKAPLSWLEKKISHRVDEMYQSGLKTEFLNLLNSCGSACPALQTIGYQEWLQHQNLSDQEILTHIKIHTRQYAKRQLTYFKKFEQIQWFDVSSDGFAQAKEYCRNLLQTNTISV
ncbi:MAG: tRNA dimethylallyltransferase [Patescibacteria group bacterium]|nr:MAG: tRNA dimethylallyltransferase [Patescibacteria group bacterium]